MFILSVDVGDEAVSQWRVVGLFRFKANAYAAGNRIVEAGFAASVSKSQQDLS